MKKIILSAMLAIATTGVIAQTSKGEKLYLQSQEVIVDDYENGIKLLTKAAKAGYAQAQCDLGVYYIEALDQMSEGLSWLKKSAEQGNAEAYFNLACYDEECEANPGLRRSRILKAAECGYQDAQIATGNGYCYGTLGFEQDKEKATEWYLKSMESGNTEAIKSIVEMEASADEVDYDKVVSWLRKGAEAGDSYSYNMLGNFFYMGEGGVDADIEEAIKWYTKGMELDNPDSYNQMAYVYATGNGVEVDFAKALELIDKAIEIAPNELNYKDSKGEILWMQGYKKKARQIWLDIREDRPGFFNDVNSNLNRYCLEQPKYVELVTPIFICEHPDYLKNEREGGSIASSIVSMQFDNGDAFMVHAQNATGTNPDEVIDKLKEIFSGINAKFSDVTSTEFAGLPAKTFDAVVTDDDGEVTNYRVISTYNQQYDYILYSLRRVAEENFELNRILRTLRWNKTSLDEHKATIEGVQPEYVPNIVQATKDFTWYEGQYKAWRNFLKRNVRDQNAWRNCFEAARIVGSELGEDNVVQQVLNDMDIAIPGTFVYNYCQYRQNGNLNNAEEALKKFPAEPTFRDFEVMYSYLKFFGDAAKATEMGKNYYASGIYDKEVIQYNLNELNGLPKNALYVGNGDAALIPKWLIQDGLGLHKDKLVVSFEAFARSEYANNLFAQLGLGEVPEYNEDEQDYGQYIASLIKLIAKKQKRQIYLSSTNGEEINQYLWPSANEGVAEHVYDENEKRPDGAKATANLVEKVYDWSYLDKPLADDAWDAASRLSYSLFIPFVENFDALREKYPATYAKLINYLVKAVDRSNESDEMKAEMKEQLLNYEGE